MVDAAMTGDSGLACALVVISSLGSATNSTSTAGGGGGAEGERQTMHAARTAWARTDRVNGRTLFHATVAVWLGLPNSTDRKSANVAHPLLGDPAIMASPPAASA